MMIFPKLQWFKSTPKKQSALWLCDRSSDSISSPVSRSWKAGVSAQAGLANTLEWVPGDGEDGAPGTAPPTQSNPPHP